jgi:hypothetical protein
VLPSEVNSWGGDANKLDQVRRRRRMVYLNEDWRTGLTVFDLISRNERLRAFAC